MREEERGARRGGERRAREKPGEKYLKCLLHSHIVLFLNMDTERVVGESFASEAFNMYNKLKARSSSATPPPSSRFLSSSTSSLSSSPDNENESETEIYFRRQEKVGVHSGVEPGAE